jgi:hypothetical protein
MEEEISRSNNFALPSQGMLIDDDMTQKALLVRNAA